jgi:hypothetical protein
MTIHSTIALNYDGFYTAKGKVIIRSKKEKLTITSLQAHIILINATK